MYMSPSFFLYKIESDMIYKGFDKSFYAVVTARFVNRFGDFVRFLLVLILSVSLGLSDKEVGAVSSLSFAATLLGQVLSGVLSDRFSRSRLLPLFQCLIAACYLSIIPLIGISSRMVIGLMLLSSVFRGAVFPITNALASDLVSDSRRREAYSLLYLVTNAGVAIGSIVAGFLFKSLHLLFLLSAVMLIADALIIVMFVPSRIVHNADDKNKTAVNSIDCRIFAFVAVFSAIGLLYNFMYQSTFFVLPLEMTSIFGSDKGAPYYSYVSMVNAISVLVLTAIVTVITKSFRYSVNMAAAMLFYAAGLFMLSLSGSLAFFMISMAVWTIGEILIATNVNAFLNSSIPAENRGFFNSFYFGVESLGGAIAPMLCGSLIFALGYRSIWFMLFLLSLLIALSYMIVGRIMNK